MPEQFVGKLAEFKDGDRRIIFVGDNEIGVFRHDGKFYDGHRFDNLEIEDRVGGGDGFASGLAYGFLEGKGPQAAVEYGAAHGALAMTTPGDTSMVNVAEVEAVMKGKGARVIR